MRVQNVTIVTLLYMIIRILVSDSSSIEAINLIEGMGIQSVEQSIKLLTPHFIFVNRVSDTYELSNTGSGKYINTLENPDWKPELMLKLTNESKRSRYPFNPNFQNEKYLYAYCKKENKGRSEGLNHLVSEFKKQNPI